MGCLNTARHDRNAYLARLIYVMEYCHEKKDVLDGSNLSRCDCGYLGRKIWISSGSLEEEIGYNFSPYESRMSLLDSGVMQSRWDYGTLLFAVHEIQRA